MYRKEANMKFTSELLSSKIHGGDSVDMSPSDDSVSEVETARGEDKGDVSKVEVADVNLVPVDADIEIELQRVSTCLNHQMTAYDYTRHVKLEAGLARASSRQGRELGPPIQMLTRSQDTTLEVSRCILRVAS